MAIFYTTTDDQGRKRWHISENEARFFAAEIGGATIERSEIDEMEARNWAAKWRNMSEKASETAKKRESRKTKQEASKIAKKVWAKRRENGTDKRKK